MLAGLVTAHRRFELVEFPEPTATGRLAVVDIAACGICGTDIHGFAGHDPYNPAICGHEWAGTVRAVGPEVRGVREGDRVVAGVSAACGGCAPCIAGNTQWCVTSFLGMVGRDPLAPVHGGFAPSIAIDAGRLIPIRSAILTDEQAAMVEPATVCLHAMRRTRLRAGDMTVVIGAGPIGLFMLQCAKLAGAGHLLVVEPTEARRRLALELGADEVCEPGDAQRLVLERSAGQGADVVFECAGVASTIQVAVDLARRGGTVSLVGFAAGEASIAPARWLTKELAVVTSLGYLHHEFGLVMDLIADGRIRTAPMHTETVGLGELGATMERLADDPLGAVKVLVDPRR